MSGLASAVETGLFESYDMALQLLARLGSHVLLYFKVSKR